MSIEVKKAEKFEENKDWAGALAIYKGLLISKPNNLPILEKIGWCQSRLELYEEAITTFKDVLKLEPNKAKWYYMIGYQYYGQQDWKNAIEWFKKALKYYPSYFVVKYRLGYALTKVCGAEFKLTKPEYLEAYKQFDECRVLWSKMTQIQQANERAHFADVCFQIGKIFIERYDYEHAIENLKKSVELNPKSWENRYQLAKAYSRSGNQDEALKYLPNDDTKYFILELRAMIWIRKGEHDKGLKILEAAAKRRNRDYLWREIAKTYLLKKNFNSAFTNLMKAIKLQKDNHKNHFVLAQTYHSAGLLLAAKNESLLSIQLKKNKYDAEYPEAKTLLDTIERDIQSKGYTKDDEKLLAELNAYSDQGSDLVKGIIKTYNSIKGFGFIDSESEKKPIFFHVSSVPKALQMKLKEGQKLTFKIIKTEKGLAAIEIKLTV